MTSFRRGYVGTYSPPKIRVFSSLANGFFRLNLLPWWSIKSQSFPDKKGGQETSSGISRVSAAFSLSALNVPKELCEAAQNISGFWKWFGRARIPGTIIDTVYHSSWESCEIFLSLLISTLEAWTAKHTMTWTDGVSTVLATFVLKWAPSSCQPVVRSWVRSKVC